MNKKPVAILLHSHKNPFYARMKRMKMSYEDFKKEKLDKNDLLIRDTRGRIFLLAGMAGEAAKDPKTDEEYKFITPTDEEFKFKNPQFDKEYPIVAIVKERENGDFEILTNVSEPDEVPYNTETEEGENAA